MIAADLRKRRQKPHGTWHLDEDLSEDRRPNGLPVADSVDAEGKVLDVLVQSKQKQARRLEADAQAFEEICLRPRGDWSPTISDHTAPPSMFLGSNAGMNAGDGRTIERGIRINRRGGGSARCSGSRARVQPKIPVNACRRLLGLQRPTSSHFSPNAPRAASRCGDGHRAGPPSQRPHKPSEPPTLRARPRGNA